MMLMAASIANATLNHHEIDEYEHRGLLSDHHEDHDQHYDHHEYPTERSHHEDHHYESEEHHYPVHHDHDDYYHHEI